MRRLYKFCQLTTGDRLLLLVTLGLLAAVRLGLWLFPFRTLLKMLSRLSQPAAQPRPSDPVTLRKIVWAVEVSSRLMPGSVKCLARALTTQVLLSRLDYAADLQIGVAKGARGLEAHAWIECQGQIVIGNLQDLSRFVRLPSLEGVRR
jgi:hypothetical protein